MVSTNIDNNDNDVEEENSLVGSEIAGSSSREREELSSSWSETPVDIEKVTPSQKVSRQRKRISHKFERMEGLMEKRLKYRKIAKKQLEKWKLSGGKEAEREPGFSNETAITSASPKHTTPSPEHTWNFKYASPRPFM